MDTSTHHHQCTRITTIATLRRSWVSWITNDDIPFTTFRFGASSNVAVTLALSGQLNRGPEILIADTCPFCSTPPDYYYELPSTIWGDECLPGASDGFVITSIIAILRRSQPLHLPQQWKPAMEKKSFSSYQPGNFLHSCVSAIPLSFRLRSF